MTLQEILIRLDENGDDITLSSSSGVYTASGLLASLPLARLNTRAHVQPGLYIAEVDDKGYMGAVMYRFSENNTGQGGTV